MSDIPTDLPESKPRSAQRCEVYTRKSSEEVLDQEYNSIDAQTDKKPGWPSAADRLWILSFDLTWNHLMANMGS